MIIKVEVTQKHIDAGFRNQCKRCPVARAAADAVGAQIGDVEVHSYVWFKTLEGNPAFYLPEPVLDFISFFDSYRPDRKDKVKPFTFLLTDADRVEEYVD